MTRVLSRPAQTSSWAALAPALAVLGAGILAIGALFYPELRAAVSVWSESTAYGHCFLVIPIAAYLAWDRRDRLRGVAIQPLPALAWLAIPLGVGWLAAERLGIMEGRQLVVIAFFQLLTLVVLGWRLTRALAAPLVYLFFLVPFGAFLVPALQDITAAFVVGGLNAIGIPNVSDLYTIEIPEGTFYVAEACAGLRFLIASIAFGVLFAFLNYRDWGRRAVFIAASIVVPVVANGIRALGIVVLGHILGSAQAAAVDHILYGWIFFNIVLLLLLLAGLPFRQAPRPAAPSPLRTAPIIGNSPVWAAAMVVLLVSVAPAISAMLDARAADVAGLDRLPLADVPGCRRGVERQDRPDRRDLAFTCAGVPLNVTIQLVPSRSNPARLIAAQRELSGALGAEEAETHELAIQGEPSHWRLTETSTPAREVAMNTWIDGALAVGVFGGACVRLGTV